MTTVFRLDGKTAMVTGAAGALGRHFARTLASAGARVVLGGRRIEPLRELADELARDGLTSCAISMDVTDSQSIHAAYDEAQATFDTIDIVVSNAGVASTKKSMDMSADDWSAIVDVNLKGGWLVCNEAARRLAAAQRPGSLINITSILGHRVAGAVVAYAAAKAGLEHMTKALALEWARYGIRVNALAPGYIETDLNRDFFASDAGRALINRIPQRRLGQAEDLEGALLLLASDASRYITGSSIVIDGGHLQSSL